MPNISALGLDTSNYTTSAAFFGDGEMDSRGMILPVKEKTGKLAGMKTVTDNDDIILITSDGVIIRMHTDEISSYSRQTQGVRVMRLDDGVSVMSIARTEREEETDEEAENSEEVIADDTTETQIADESKTEGDVE